MKMSINRVFVAAAVALIMAVASAMSPVSTQAADHSDKPQAPPVSAWFGCVHTVRPGETFFSIALMHGMSPFALVDMNGMSSFDFIFPGIVLRVPCFIVFPSPVVQPVIFPFQPFAGICNIHFVQRGEWLKLIAIRFGVSWQSIAAVNRLFNPNLIFPGERLLIPCAQASTFSPNAAPSTGYSPPSSGYMPPSPGYVPPSPGGTTPPPNAGLVTAMMMNIMFSPATIYIHVGNGVRWQNMDSVQHSATQGICSGNMCSPTPGGFDTGILNPGQMSAPIAFNSPGTFHFYCRIHGAMMQGDVVVMP